VETIAVSARRAAELLDVSPDAVNRWVKAGHLARVPHLTIVRIPVADIKRFAESGMTHPQPPEWLADRWVNVNTGMVVRPGRLLPDADREASDDRIGRVSLAGQWVPCDGKQVLA